MENTWNELKINGDASVPDRGRFLLNKIETYILKVIRNNGTIEYYKWVPDNLTEEEDGEWLLLSEYPSNKVDKYTGLIMPPPNKL